MKEKICGCVQKLFVVVGFFFSANTLTRPSLLHAGLELRLKYCSPLLADGGNNIKLQR